MLSAFPSGPVHPGADPSVWLGTRDMPTGEYVPGLEVERFEPSSLTLLTKKERRHHQDLIRRPIAVETSSSGA